jgi:phage-related protein
VFYVAKYAEAVYVLHAFQKASPKTARRDIETGRRRLGEVMRARRASGRSP